jgi:hypothetical protein
MRRLTGHNRPARAAIDNVLGRVAEQGLAVR